MSREIIHGLLPTPDAMDCDPMLAANRLVRIAGYGRVARFYARRGDRPTCALAVIAAACCSLGSASLSGFWARYRRRRGRGRDRPASIEAD